MEAGERAYTVDALDLRIFRALLTDNAVAPASNDIRTSLREIARRLQADDMTVRNRFRKLQAAGLFSAWRLVINPRIFGLHMKSVCVDAHPETKKEEILRDLRAVPGVVVIANQFGPAIELLVLHADETALSRTVGQISRIVRDDDPVVLRMPLPEPMTHTLSDVDWAILRSLEPDARKSYLLVARELGLSSRTVKTRLRRLVDGRMAMAWPDLNAGSVHGMIPFELRTRTRPGMRRPLWTRPCSRASAATCSGAASRTRSTESSSSSPQAWPSFRRAWSGHGPRPGWDGLGSTSSSTASTCPRNCGSKPVPHVRKLTDHRLRSPWSSACRPSSGGKCVFHRSYDSHPGSPWTP